MAATVKKHKVRLVKAPEAGKAGVVKIDNEPYLLRLILGRAEHLVGLNFQKIVPENEGGNYDVDLVREHPTCECKGWLRWGHCKHLAATAQLSESLAEWRCGDREQKPRRQPPDNGSPARPLAANRGQNHPEDEMSDNAERRKTEDGGRKEEPKDIAQALARPFDAAEIKFKPGATSGGRALAMPYVDARVVQDRLDEVLGVMGWQDSYERLPDGAVVCRLQIRIDGGEWITKTDVGGESEQPDGGDRTKAAFSDALKRAAVKFGVGRYLYRQKPQWVDYDAQKRQFTKQPTLAAQPATKAPKPTAAKLPANGRELQRRLYEADANLAKAGGCAAGALVRHVVAAGKKAGHGEDLAQWNSPEAIALAAEETRFFKESAKEREGAGAA